MNTKQTYIVNSYINGGVLFTLSLITYVALLFVSLSYDQLLYLAIVSISAIFIPLLIFLGYFWFIYPKFGFTISGQGVELFGYSPTPILIEWSNIRYMGGIPDSLYLGQTYQITDQLVVIYLKDPTKYVHVFTEQNKKRWAKFTSQKQFNQFYKLDSQEAELPDITIGLATLQPVKAKIKILKQIKQLAPQVTNQENLKFRSTVPAEIERDANQVNAVSYQVDQVLNQAQNNMGKNELKQVIEVFLSLNTWQNHSQTTKFIWLSWWWLLAVGGGLTLAVLQIAFGRWAMIGTIIAIGYWFWVRPPWRYSMLPKSFAKVIDGLDPVSKLDPAPILLWFAPMIIGGIIMVALLILLPMSSDYSALPQIWFTLSLATPIFGAIFSLIFLKRARIYLEKVKNNHPELEHVFAQLRQYRSSLSELRSKTDKLNIGITLQ